MNVLPGKKTFILSALLVIYAIAGFFTGHLTMQQAVDTFGIGGVGAFLRLAIK